MIDLSFNRTEMLKAASYTLFGKLPNRADFVRVNANHPVALEFDGLIQSAFERKASELEAVECGSKGRAVDFQYVSQDQRNILVGVLVPSKDKAGRRYPLVAAAILPYQAIEGFLPVLPIAFEVFFDGLRDQVVNAVENSVEALSCRQFLESSLRSYGKAEDEFRLAQSVITRFMSQQPARRMGDLLNNGARPATLQQALLNIAFYQAYLRRFDNRATNQLCLLPLSGNKGEQSLIASTWLSILSSLWAEEDSASSWRGSTLQVHRQGGVAHLVACVGRLPDSFGNVMLGAEIESSMLLDLGIEHEAWTSHRMYAEASYALGRFLADPEFRISLLCDFLRDMSRQLVGNV